MKKLVLISLKTLPGPGRARRYPSRNAEVLGSNPGRWDVRHRVCAYTVLQTVRRPGVCSAVYGTMHYK